MPMLALRRSRVASIIGSALGGLFALSMPLWAQVGGDDVGKNGQEEPMVITGQNRDQVRLTPEQQRVVDKLIRLPETVNRHDPLSQSGSA